MKRVFSLFVLTVSLTPIFANRVGVTSFTLPPRASGHDQVDGRIKFIVFESRVNKSRLPFKNCALIHGYGITHDLLRIADKLVRVAGKLDPHAELKALKGFAYIYFGQELISQMLNNACENVYVAIQETNQSTILEMTERTERFLKEQVCNVPADKLLDGQKTCAVVAHSKGGAVAFTAARRCMQRKSPLGESGCRQIGKIYSATGVIQGAGAPALIYGAKKISEDKLNRESFASIELMFNKWAGLLGGALLNAGHGFWDLDSDKSTSTNPTWFDLAPTAPLEANSPIFLANDIVLKREGWLDADFAASATPFDFETEDGTPGCGTDAPKPLGIADKILYGKRLALCEGFGKSLSVIHAGLHKESFNRGRQEFARVAALYNNLHAEKGDSSYLDRALTWEGYQLSDGFADYHLAIDACKKGLGQPDSVVTRCTDLPGLNHQASAGGAVEAYQDILEHLVSD